MVSQVLIDIGGQFGSIVWNNQKAAECVNICYLKNFLFDKTGIPVQEQIISLEGKLLPNDHKLVLPKTQQDPLVVRLKLPILGGKGGFGALLRGAGAKASKRLKTSTDDCRDLNGRRIRHVKNEQRLAEWYSAQQAVKDKEETQKTKKKHDATPTYHAVEDPKFASRMKDIEETIASSVECGIQEAKRLQELKSQKKELEAAEQVERKPKVPWDDEFDDVDPKIPSLVVLHTDAEKDVPEPHHHSQPITLVIHDLAPNNEKIAAVDSANQDEDTTEDNQLDLDDYGSAVELESVGLDRLKAELQKRGLKMGGSLKERAERLFSVKGKNIEEIDPSLFAGKDTKRKRK